MAGIPAKVPEGMDTRSSLQKRHDRQLLKKSLAPARYPNSDAEPKKETERRSENAKRDYQAVVSFEGKRYDFAFMARDAEDALARARWFLMHEHLGSDMDKVERILALDGSQIELSEKTLEA